MPTLPAIDTDATWNRIRERGKEYVPREVVVDDDSHNSSDNEESESDEDYEFEAFYDEEAKESECSGKSVVSDFFCSYSRYA